jgi:uncharacterized protein YjbI with pentapeptide repeats
MKIFKKNEHSLLIKTFGIRNTLYLATTILIFFDLTNPDDPLTEQELWKAVPDQLGGDAFLDMGMAKPRGEVVVTGSCFAPRGTERVASEISLRVGEKRKALNVFGNRFWEEKGGVMKLIKDPEPFTEMPVTYQNAFGGDGFDKNPLGKGIHPGDMPDGRKRIPLPNVEDPRHLVGAPSDRPHPAGFGPLDLMWPQRMKKQGTYDDKWKNERWPWFPDDMDYEFFNVAPEDQFIQGFFRGDETVEIVNMHPDMQVINSRLPRLRVRCFVTKKNNPRSTGQDNEIFQEVSTRIDTVWLFPTILRGVAVYRGTTEVKDDEFADVSRIFLRSEGMDEEPKPIEYYYEEQKKAMDRKVPVDMAPLEKAQKKIAAAMKRFKDLPKELETKKLQAMGKAPKMQRTPEEIAGRSRALIDSGMALVARLESQARGMHAQYGHLVKIDLGKFDEIRQKLTKASGKIDTAMGKIDEARKKGDEMKKEMSDLLKQNVSPEDLKAAGIDPDNLIPEKSVNPWHDRGFPLVIGWRKNLEGDHDTLNKLYLLGFNRRTIKRGWFGFNPDELSDDAAVWGLKPEADKSGAAKPLIIPRGLVMPRFDGATLNRVNIRPGDFTRSDDDILVQESDETPLALLADEGAPFVCVPGELEAWLVEQEIGDACSVIAMKDPAQKPDKEVQQYIDGAPVVLVVMTAKESKSGAKWGLWEKAFPAAKQLILPKGNDIFDERRRGTDLRQWIMEALPPEYAGRHQIDPSIPGEGEAPTKSPMAGLALPVLDVKAMIKSMTDEIKAFHQPKIDALMKMKSEMDGQARDAILKAGKDPDAVLAAGKAQEKQSFSELGNQLSQAIGDSKEKLRAEGHLTPEVEKKMNDAAAQVSRMGSDADTRYKDGMATIAAGKEEAALKKAKAQAGEPPEKAKEKLLGAGIDPDNVRKMTREEVIERYAEGETVAGAILSGVDLSKLDLHGIDLSRALCRKAKFCETNLDGANFSQAVGMEADFSGASLKNAVLEKGLFAKAVFKKADLSGANLHQTILKNADCTEADFTGANLDWVILQKAKLGKASLKNVNATMGVFSDADATGATFGRSRLMKCLFKSTVLDRVDFSGAAINSTMFWGVKGEGVTFDGANLDKGRMGGNASLPGASFKNISMKHGCFRDTDLAGSDFTGSTLDESILENCNLAKANFCRVPAKKCRFNKSNLEEANMATVNLFMGSLRKARLVNTDLSKSNLFAVDFYKATVGNTNFDEANLKMSQLHNRTDLLD